VELTPYIGNNQFWSKPAGLSQNKPEPTKLIGALPSPKKPKICRLILS
jgi:hypothetical protein